MLLHFLNVLISIMFSLFHSFVRLWCAYGSECSMGYVRKPDDHLWELHPVGPWGWPRLLRLAATASAHWTILPAPYILRFKKSSLLYLSWEAAPHPVCLPIQAHDEQNGITFPNAFIRREELSAEETVQAKCLPHKHEDPEDPHEKLGFQHV